MEKCKFYSSENDGCLFATAIENRHLTQSLESFRKHGQLQPTKAGGSHYLDSGLRLVRCTVPIWPAEQAKCNKYVRETNPSPTDQLIEEIILKNRIT